MALKGEAGKSDNTGGDTLIGHHLEGWGHTWLSSTVLQMSSGIGRKCAGCAEEKWLSVTSVQREAGGRPSEPQVRDP
jgi:hypothetical protein